MTKKTVLTITLVALATFIVALSWFLYRYFLYNPAMDAPPVDKVEQALQVQVLQKIGPVESPLLPFSEQYGFLVNEGDKGEEKYLIVVAADLDSEQNRQYLKVLPGEKVDEQNQDVQRIVQTFGLDNKDVRVLSKHQVLKVVDGKEEILPHPLFKVHYKDRSNDYLTFYFDDETEINTFIFGFNPLQMY